MKRGPKPVDVGRLREDAYRFALSFHAVRLGWPGLLTHLKGGVWFTRLVAGLREDEVGRPERATQRIRAGQMTFSPFRYKATTFALALPLTNTMRREALKLVRKNENWRFTPPIPAKPGIWKRLKTAHSAADIRAVARLLRLSYPSLASAIYAHAQEFVGARGLPNYPQSGRRRSDDKRVQFFAKVLSGLEHGIAPATATKRLAHSTLPDTPVYRGLFNVPADYSALLETLRKGTTK